MPRSLTASQRRAFERRRSSDPYLQLATFSHRDLSQPIRIVKNPDDITSQDLLFHKGWFDIELPSDDDQPPRGQMSIPNIDREFGTLLLRLASPVRVRLQAILASEPDTVIEDYNWLFLRSISGDAQTIAGTLDSWDYTTEAWPNRTASKARCPGMWIA